MKENPQSICLFLALATSLLLGIPAPGGADAQTINVDSVVEPDRGDVAVHVPTGYVDDEENPIQMRVQTASQSKPFYQDRKSASGSCPVSYSLG